VTLDQAHLIGIGRIARGAAFLEYVQVELTSMLISRHPQVGRVVMAGQNYERARKLAVELIGVRLESDDDEESASLATCAPGWTR
jgi:hypothetical protein